MFGTKSTRTEKYSKARVFRPFSPPVLVSSPTPGMPKVRSSTTAWQLAFMFLTNKSLVKPLVSALDSLNLVIARTTLKPMVRLINAHCQRYGERELVRIRTACRIACEKCSWCSLVIGMDTGFKSQSGRNGKCPTTWFGINKCVCHAPPGVPCGNARAPTPAPPPATNIFGHLWAIARAGDAKKMARAAAAQAAV